MKQIFLIIFILSISFFSCKKPAVSSVDLTGDWRWILTSRDSGPGPLNPLTPENSGITQSLSFKANTWIYTKSNATPLSGTYITSIATDSTTGNNVNAIHYFRSGGSTDSLTFFSLSHDTLIFSYDLIGTAGSGATIYVRK